MTERDTAGCTIGAQHGRPLPGGLTRDPAKAALFGADPWFRDGWGDFVDACGSAAVSTAHRHALLLLKPDAVARRALAPTVEWLRERSSAAVSVDRIPLDRTIVRAMWHYQLGASTRDRRDLIDKLAAMTDSLLITVRLPRDPVPATVQLSARKGPADPARRTPGQLRHALGGENFLLNYVHAADEPADLARELGILLAPQRRAEVIGAMARRRELAWEDVHAAASDLTLTTRPHDLRLPTALDGLAASLRAAGSDGDPAAAQRAGHTLERLGAGERELHDWRGLLDDLRAAGATPNPWDEIVLGTTLMQASHPGVDAVIGSAAAHWQAAEAAG